MKRFILSSLAALAVAFASSSAPAVTHTWQGSTPFMATNTNWVGNVTPTSGNTALTLIFPSGFVTPFQDIATPLSVQSMHWGNYSPSGNAYKMDNLGANPSITQDVSGFTFINNDINFDDPTTITGGGTNPFMQFAGVLSGGNVTFNGGGGQTFFNISGGSANTLGGVNTVNNVSLDLQKANAIGGTLNIVSGIVNVTAGGAIDPTTDVNISSGGQLIFIPNTTLNDVDVSGGTIFINSFGGQLTITGGLSSSTGVSAIGPNSGLVALGGPTTVNVTSGGTDYLVINAAVSTGSINKIGSGMLVLGNDFNTFSGTNTVTAGTLRGSATSIGTSVTNNATVELYGGVFTSAALSGPGTVVIDGFVSYNTSQPYTGPTQVRAGGIDGNTTTLPSSITGTGTSGSVAFNQNVNGTYSGTISGPLGVFKQGTGQVTLGGNNPYTLGTTIFGGGLTITSDTAIGTGALAGFGPVILEAVGSRTLANQLQISSGATFIGAGDFNFTDTTAKVVSGPITHNSSGSTTIEGKMDVQSFASVTVNQGTLALGDPSIVNGFTSAGAVTVNGGTLTVQSLNFISLPTVTLAAGTLDVPNGYAIPLGAVLQGTGNVTGRIATANGSTIIATGALGIGTPSHPAGVNLDGELYTNQYIVSMSDSNQAVLGSLTDLGTATQNGMLSAGNGFVLNFGRNIVGRGQIQSNNQLSDAAIINGDVNGDSAINYLEFTGYVKGVGTFNNVAFSGTFSPGLSPTLMTVGNVIYLPSNVLDMELGGLSRGGQYDAFDITGVMQMNGTLKATLINAFSPSLGDQFMLFQGISGGSFTGTFSNYNFPGLNPGLAWDTSLLYTSGILQVVAAVPEPATLLPMALALAGLVWRRRGPSVRQIRG